MHIIWQKEEEFENFIKNAVSNLKQTSFALYTNAILVESYFEFITQILLGKFEMSEKDERKWKQSVAIDKLASKKLGVIDQEHKEIFHAIRGLRNKVVHNIRFTPDLKALRQFMKACFNKELDPAEEDRCLLSNEDLERFFCNQIVHAYTKISNKYKRQVDEKIAKYLNP